MADDLPAYDERDEKASSPVRLWPPIALALAFALVCIALSHMGLSVSSWSRGETTLWGRRRYTPSWPSGVSQIEFEDVHARLLPRLLLALQHLDRFRARTLADETLASLRRTLAPDRNLVELLNELDSLVRQDAKLHAQRIHWLIWAWNDYLDRQHVPYRLDVSVHGHVGHSTLWFRTYRELHREWVAVGLERFRARWLRRVDGTNVVDGDLGHTSDANDGALILMNAVTELAVQQVWPLLDPALDAQRDPIANAHAPWVRDEARVALSPDSLRILTSTARARKALVDTAYGIDGRAACGSATRVGRLPLLGFSPEANAEARAYAETSVRKECPELLPEEVDEITKASIALRSAPGLERAVVELMDWVGRAVTVHEVRHAADDARYDGLRAPLPCDPCSGLNTVARAELSAFIASFETEGVSRLAFFQACTLANDDPRSPYGAALGQLRALSLPGDCLHPPRDLLGFAHVWEAQLFGRVEPLSPPTRWLDPVLLSD